MLSPLFHCGNNKCAYAIDSEGLNDIQLKALRNWQKTCPKCKQSTLWLEQMPLLDTNTIKALDHGGSINETTTSPISSIPKSASQKRKASRYTGSH